MDNKNREVKNKKAKKRLLIAIAIILGAIALLSCASFIIDVITAKLIDDAKREEIVIDYDFYPADYDADIFENQEYLRLYDSGYLDYKNGAITLGITFDNAASHGADVARIVKMLDDVIHGDASAYNNHFSDEYYKYHDKKTSFTMQMIYDIKIERLSSEIIDEDGDNYTKSVFTVEYKIFQNNGTFRRDIGDGARRQYFTLTDKSGEWRIDSIAIATYAKK